MFLNVRTEYVVITVVVEVVEHALWELSVIATVYVYVLLIVPEKSAEMMAVEEVVELAEQIKYVKVVIVYANPSVTVKIAVLIVVEEIAVLSQHLQQYVIKEKHVHRTVVTVIVVVLTVVEENVNVQTEKSVWRTRLVASLIVQVKNVVRDHVENPVEPAQVINSV